MDDRLDEGPRSEPSATGLHCVSQPKMIIQYVNKMLYHEIPIVNLGELRKRRSTLSIKLCRDHAASRGYPCRNLHGISDV